MAGLVNDATGAASAPTVDPATTSNANATSAVATGYTAAQSQAAQMQPTTGTASTAGLTTNNVNSNQTVAGQLQGLIDDNSPLLQQARTQALESANQKGLLNTSMAQTGAESAVLSEALPIAQQDASTNFSNAENNMAATNQNSQFNAGQTQSMTNENLGIVNSAAQVNTANQQQTGLANQSATNQAEQFTAGAQNTASIQNSQEANQVQLQAMDDDNKVQLANIQAQYQELMQSSQSASNIYTAAVNNITSIMTNTNMDPTSKQNAVNQQVQMLQSGLVVAGQVANVDLGNLLNFSSGDIAQQANPAPAPAPADVVAPTSGGALYGNPASDGSNH